MNDIHEKQASRVAGIILMAAAALAIFFMLHHPSTSSHEMGEALKEIRDEGSISAWVHGLLMLVMIGIWFGTYELTQRLGADRALPILGFMFFGLGTIAYCLAAMVSGFVVPEIGARYAGLSATEIEQARGLLRISGITNQAFAKAGLIGTSVGIFCWSVLLLTRGSSARAAGLIGLVLGLLPPIMLLMGYLTLHVTGMTAVVVAHSAWYGLIGYLMVWGSLRE